MKKAVLVLLLIVAAVTGIFAQSISDFETEVVNGNVTITRYRGSERNVVIPARINGLPVTVIGGDAFYRYFNGDPGLEAYRLTSVIIPNSVKTIGGRAFSHNLLTSVIIPDSVTSIEGGAFASNNLKIVAIPNSVISIGEEAFSYNLLTSVTIPDSVTSIGNGAFSPQYGDFDGDVFSILRYKGTATIIGYNRDDPRVVIPARINGLPVNAIGDRAFFRKQLTSVTIPDSVTSIGGAAFSRNRLTSVTIPNSVTSIGTSSFGDDAFSPQEKVLGGDAFSIMIYKGTVTIIGYNRDDPRVVIPARINGLPVSAIGIGVFAYEFYGNQLKLTSVTIPNSVTSIGNNAFSGSQLTGVTIPNSVTSIGDHAFEGNRLTGVTIPDSVTSIGIWAFSGNQLISITIGNSVDLGDYAFGDNGVAEHYMNNGRRAGLYIQRNGAWTYIPR
jgi:hypothetical protein